MRLLNTGRFSLSVENGSRSLEKIVNARQIYIMARASAVVLT